MARIAEETVQQVMNTAQIVDVIGSYISVKRAGTSYKAVCPFHAERTPSFHINPARNTFKCFGCGKAGTSLTFVKEYENITFWDAVRKLAQRYGIVVKEEEVSEEERARSREKGQLLDLHQRIAKWFHELLLRSPQAEAGRAYLTGRGLGSDVAKRWLIGYAPPDRMSYVRWAQENKFSEQVLVQGGIMYPARDGNPKRCGGPRFEHRVMFPVRNEHGDVIAFSGRMLVADNKGRKYLNSPDTPLFNKSAVLFGFDRSRRAIGKEQNVILCEGQIDLITCVESGIENMVAPLGTAFTEQHARILRRATDTAILCFDADEAGAKATDKVFTLLAKEGLFVRVMTLPEDDDPDTLIRRDGVEEFRRRLAAAKDYFDHFVERNAAAFDGQDPRERTRLSRELASHIARVREKVTQDAAIFRVCARLGMPADDLRKLATDAAKIHQREAEREAETQKRQAQLQAAKPQQDRQGGGNPPRSNNGLSEAEMMAAGMPPGEETIPELEAPPVVIDNPSIRLLLHLALTDAEARVWLRENADRSVWASFSGSDLLDHMLDSQLEVTAPEQVAAWVASLPSAEEELLHSMLDQPPPAGGGLGAEIAVLRLSHHLRMTRLGGLQTQLRQTGISVDQVDAMIDEITLLRQEVLEIEQRLRDISAPR